MVASLQIKGAKHTTIKQVINARQRILIFCGDLVEGAVIYAHLQFPILNCHKDDRGPPGKVARSDKILAGDPGTLTQCAYAYSVG